MRLRKKTWRSPCTIYLDSQVFDKDIHVFANFEIYIECLDGKVVGGGRGGGGGGGWGEGGN